MLPANTMQSVREFWKRKGPQTRMDAIVVYGAMATVVGLLALGIMLGATTERSLSIDMEITNSSRERVHVFTNGYLTVSLADGRVWSDRMFDCRDGCLIEVSDTDGHVLCAFTLTEELADSIDHRMVVTGSSPPSTLCNPQPAP